MRNIDLRGAYSSMYEQKDSEQLDEIVGAALGGLGKAALGAAAASPAVAGGVGGTIGAATGGKKKVKKAIGTGSGAAVGGAVGGPVGAVLGGLAGNAIANSYEPEHDGDQLDELAPLVAGAAGKLAGGLAAKGATAGAAKAAAGKGLMAKAGKAAGTKMGQRAIGAGANKVQDSVTNRLSDKNEEVEVSYTAQYMEGYKKLPKHKMQDKAAMKPDTARGEKQARKMDLVRKATEAAPDVVKKVTKGVQLGNNKRGLERRFNAPSADNAAEKKRKNQAYKLEGQRRKDLDKRYGPKKEQAAAVFEYLLGEGYTTTEDGTLDFMTHMSDGFFNAILVESLKD